MGQGQSHPASTFYAFGGPQSSPPLKFSSRHGDNCQVLREGSQVRRSESFCKGIVFSDRAVEVGERICIRLTELSIRWSGVLRLGFSSHDPHSLQTLPKYACPDLTGKPGFWAKALAEKYAESNSLIHYYFSSSGDVHYGINGVDKGLFFSGVDARQPLWMMIDLYGNCTAIELVDMRRSLNNFTDNRELETVSDDEEDTDNTVENVSNALNNLTVNHDDDDDQEDDDLNTAVLSSQLQHYRNINFRRMIFHTTLGTNLNINRSRTIAWRQEDEYSGGYVFSGESVRLGERTVVQVIDTENMYIGSLAFGVTSCDPATIDQDSLPEDADMLLDRPEYWVVSKDVAATPDTGDELSFTVHNDGSVEFSRNRSSARIIMHVDTSVPLWMFWDIYGNTQRLRIVGGTDEVLEDREEEEEAATEENDRNNLAMTDDIGRRSSQDTAAPPRSRSSHNIGASRSNESRSEECKICYEGTVDCVLYACGHMCLCYQCALQQWKGRGGGICPMCRETIQDVIKIYRS